MSTMPDMLNLWRRHSRTCPHRKKGRAYTKCKCTIWADGELDGKRFRRSTGVRDWQRALRKLAAWESPDTPTLKPVEEAAQAFLRHCRELAPSSLRKYRNVLEQIKGFCQTQHIGTVSELTVEVLDDFRAQRDISALTASKELQTLRQFCEFCVGRRWLDHNVAKDLRPPKAARPKEINPYTEAEVARIIAACDEIGKSAYERKRARAMILLMRYTGLRISDVMTLARDRVKDGMIHLHTQKTAGVVRLPVPVELRRALDELPVPRASGKGCPYFLWNGHTSRRQIVTMGHKTLAAVFKKAGVANARTHRFRHSLATEILAKGGTIQDVADVLGISSHVAAKHYAKWNRARDERIMRLMERVHGRIYDRDTSGRESGLPVQ